jgi:flagellar biosynthesis protein FlhF
MKLKTYVASDPQEALAQVRKELGPEAVILSTQSRSFHSPESSWAQRRRVEVTAALDQAVPLDYSSTFQARPLGPENSGLPFNYLREELEEIKALLKQWLREHGPPSWLAPYQDLTLLFQALLRIGVHDQIMHRWLGKVRTLLKDGKGESPNNLRDLALRQLMKEIEVMDPWKISPQGPRRWTFFGSTGVGKTTTIAKLAIEAAFVKKVRVGLISLDNVRLGGQEQLSAYARVSGLPLIAAQTRSELAKALEKMGDLELILIDTPGRNPTAPELPLELRQLFGELPGLEHHLVVSATTSEGNIADACQGFNVLPLASGIVTKVDECPDIVGVFNQLCIVQVPFSYLTTGQRVPEDIELATRQRLAELLLKPQNCQRFQK